MRKRDLWDTVGGEKPGEPMSHNANEKAVRFLLKSIRLMNE